MASPRSDSSDATQALSECIEWWQHTLPQECEEEEDDDVPRSVVDACDHAREQVAAMDVATARADAECTQALHRAAQTMRLARDMDARVHFNLTVCVAQYLGGFTAADKEMLQDCINAQDALAEARASTVEPGVRPNDATVSHGCVPTLGGRTAIDDCLRFIAALRRAVDDVCASVDGLAQRTEQCVQTLDVCCMRMHVYTAVAHPHSHGSTRERLLEAGATLGLYAAAPAAVDDGVGKYSCGFPEGLWADACDRGRWRPRSVDMPAAGRGTRVASFGNSTPFADTVAASDDAENVRPWMMATQVAELGRDTARLFDLERVLYRQSDATARIHDLLQHLDHTVDEAARLANQAWCRMHLLERILASPMCAATRDHFYRCIAEIMVRTNNGRGALEQHDDNPFPLTAFPRRNVAPMTHGRSPLGWH